MSNALIPALEKSILFNLLLYLLNNTKIQLASCGQAGCQVQTYVNLIKTVQCLLIFIYE